MTDIAETNRQLYALATVVVRPDLVRAGVLHVPYSHGDFGDGRHDATEPERPDVGELVDLAEQLHEVALANRIRQMSAEVRACSAAGKLRFELVVRPCKVEARLAMSLADAS
jgi:hypothetical protein